MSKISVFDCFSLLLVLILFIAAAVKFVDAQNRCEKILEKDRCDLPKCREECFKIDGFGQCIEESGATGVYSCICVYNCPPS